MLSCRASVCYAHRPEVSSSIPRCVSVKVRLAVYDGLYNLRVSSRFISFHLLIGRLTLIRLESRLFLLLQCANGLRVSVALGSVG